MTKADWLRIGYEQGWCSPQVCAMHDGIPEHDLENDMIADGEEVCQWIVRTFVDKEQRDAVMEDCLHAQARAAEFGYPLNI